MTATPITDALDDILLRDSDDIHFQYIRMRAQAREFERTLTAMTEHCEKLEARYEWTVNELLACDYGDNDKGMVGWYVFGWRRLKHPADRRIYGSSIDAAIDAEIKRSTGLEHSAGSQESTEAK